MRYFVVAASLVVGSFIPLATTVLAADYAPQPVLRGALPGTDKGTDWSGFYVGGTGSYANINTASSGSGGAIDPTLRSIVNPQIAASISLNPLVEKGINQNSRIGFGLYAGYNWAVDDYVVGLEADYTRAKLQGGSEGNRNGITTPQDGFGYNWRAITEKKYTITDYGSFRFRMGYAWDNWLPYVAAGLAYSRASVKSDATISADQQFYVLGSPVANPLNGPTVFNPSSSGQSNGSKFFFGYALGAGLDVAITQNLIVRAEFQHLRFTDVAGSGLQLNQAKLGAALKF